MAGVYDLVVVLLKENEGSMDLMAAYQDNGLDAYLVPFTVGLATVKPMSYEDAEHVRRAVDNVSKALSDGRTVLVHCSAGIHRTGTFSYAVLRHLGYTPDEALDHIKSLRSVTYYGMLPFVKWAEETLVDPAWVYDVGQGEP